MSFKLNDLLKQGVVNLFSTEENNNYVLILAFKNKTFVVDLVSNKSGNIAYVDPAKGYDLTEIFNLQDFVFTKLNKVYSSIAKFDFLQVSPVPARSNVIKSYVISRGNKADNKILDKILTDNGYDISKLYKSITATSTVRDYSSLLLMAHKYNLTKIITTLAKEENTMEKTNVILGVAAVQKPTAKITKIVVNKIDRCTVVFFDDGKSENVKCSPEDEFDPYVGVAIAKARHEYGSTGAFHRAVDAVSLVVKPKPKKIKTGPVAPGQEPAEKKSNH